MGQRFQKMKYYFIIILFGIIFILVLILGFRSPPEEQGDEIASPEPAGRTEWRKWKVKQQSDEIASQEPAWRIGWRNKKVMQQIEVIESQATSWKKWQVRGPPKE